MDDRYLWDGEGEAPDGSDIADWERHLGPLREDPGTLVWPAAAPSRAGAANGLWVGVGVALAAAAALALWWPAEPQPDQPVIVNAQTAAQTAAQTEADPRWAQASDCTVTVYKAEWCNVCQNLLAYLDASEIEYEARDIDKDPGAADEFSEKARAAGVTEALPLIEVDGEIIQGFDRDRIETALNADDD